jgi:hypothetical protein
MPALIVFGFDSHLKVSSQKIDIFLLAPHLAYA